MLEGLKELAKVSPPWKVIFDNWNELKSTYYTERGADQSGDRSFEGTTTKALKELLKNQ